MLESANTLVRHAFARWLEAGTLSRVWPDALARAHAHVAGRAVARPLAVPRGVVVVTVGGATLGGSGKTRVAVAVSRALARRGARVVLVGHAYRARPSGARIVAPDDPLHAVGDEALTCARVLADAGRVVVAPTRQAAVDFAASLAPRVDVIVLDGPLQLAPVRASLALLAVDAHAPWGADALPPAGDLRAPRAALIAHADLVVPVDAMPRAALVSGVRVELSSLSARLARGGGPRTGLFTAIARPARLESALRGAGLDLPSVVRAPDHGPLTPGLVRRIRASEVDLWLTTEKCALHLASVVSDRSIAVLDGACDLPAEVESALASLAPRREAHVVGGRPAWGGLTPRMLRP